MLLNKIDAVKRKPYEDLIKSDYCLNAGQYYDKYHYAKFNTTEIALTKACGLCKNKGKASKSYYWSYHSRYCNA